MVALNLTSTYPKVLIDLIIADKLGLSKSSTGYIVKAGTYSLTSVSVFSICSK